MKKIKRGRRREREKEKETEKEITVHYSPQTEDKAKNQLSSKEIESDYRDRDISIRAIKRKRA